MPSYRTPCGKMVEPGRAFETNGITYPPEFLDHATHEDLAEHGILAIGGHHGGKPTDRVVRVPEGRIPHVATPPASLLAEMEAMSRRLTEQAAHIAKLQGAVVAVAPLPPVNTIRFDFRGHVFEMTSDAVARLSLVVNLANAAIRGGVRAGDVRWLSPDVDFGWLDTSANKLPLDAPSLIEFAAAAYGAHSP
jgi:hypothetical protein